MSYKLLVGKHVPNISFPIVPIIDEYGLFGEKDVPNMESIFGKMKSHIKNVFVKVLLKY